MLWAMGLFATVTLAACGRYQEQPAAAERPQMRTPADSLAYRMVDAHGGFDAWPAAHYLRFDLGYESGGTVRPIARHLWDRVDGNYRIEWPRGTDTTVTVLLNVKDRQGAAFVNGQAPDSVSEGKLVDEAYRRFINDTYWLLAPLKVFDEGVIREVAADSSSSDVDVLALSFEGVGLTPGDRYWIAIRRSNGLVDRWSYILQGREDRPPSTHNWVDYRVIETPAGTVRLSERKERVGAEGALLTHHVSMPTHVPDDIFTNPSTSLK